MTISVFTYANKPEIRDQIDILSKTSWPEFLLHGNIYHWDYLFDLFPEYQVLLCDPEDTLLGVGHSVPIHWSGSLSNLPRTIEEILLRAEKVHVKEQMSNTISAVAAMVRPEHRGKNISTRIIQEMKILVKQNSCTSLIAPVRPIWKSRYPLSPMERYINWKQIDGSPFDPWIRVHWRMGAIPLCIAPNTLTVDGDIQEWENWTQMVFPDSGLYVIPGGLQPVKIDREQNKGVYKDPNYWMKHLVE